MKEVIVLYHRGTECDHSEFFGDDDMEVVTFEDGRLSIRNHNHSKPGCIATTQFAAGHWITFSYIMKVSEKETKSDGVFRIRK